MAYQQRHRPGRLGFKLTTDPASLRTGTIKTSFMNDRINKTSGIWDILGRIWAVWAILLFVTTMLVFMIPFLLFCYFQPDPLKTRRFISYSRIWMGVFLPLAGCPLRIRGREKFAEAATYIVVCNHNGLI